ncbi:hypothetical protein [Phytoactinopolyspora limicola]|uniref:hypothetical protein n=1 Tax=Phytoactinopolyspora limicola TaxID=2715536 RepID=UPI0014096346|nr:hypothetical protein [Phytoactinopolyspora limicola]
MYSVGMAVIMVGALLAVVLAGHRVDRHRYPDAQSARAAADQAVVEHAEEIVRSASHRLRREASNDPDG